MTAVHEARASHQQLVRAVYWMAPENRLEVNPVSSPREKRKPLSRKAKRKQRAKA